MSSARRTALKPFRLRGACDSCHLAKVKCSSDKPSCQRCIANNFECSYSISMTGKVQGANRHNKRPRHENSVVAGDSPRNQTLLEAINLSSCDDAAIVADPPATQVAHMLPPQAVTSDAADVRRSAMILLSPPEPEPETAMPWPVQDSLSTDILFDIEESFLRPSADEHLHSQQHPERQEAHEQVPDASMSAGLETSPLDPEARITGNASREASSSATSEAQPSLRQALSSTLGAPDRLPLNCIPLLEKLWRRDGSAHLRPDLIMATNKTVVSALYKLLPDLDDCDKNEPDLMLYTLIMQAIVNSYRQVCDSWVQSGSDSSGPLNRGPQAPHHMPGLGFGFGTFEIDSESQRELFKQVMRREIDKAMLLWTKIWAVISSQQLNGRGGKGICENILLEAGIILKRMMTEISASVAVTVRSGA